MTNLTREEYMKDSSNLHHAYYAQFVTTLTLNFILGSLTIEGIKQAIESGDKHLNDIKIPFNNMGSGGNWWWDNAPINSHLAKELGEGNSCSTHTCVGKAAARMLASGEAKAI